MKYAYELGAEPQQAAVNIYYWIDEGKFLYEDTFVPPPTVHSLLDRNVIKQRGLCVHQGLHMLRYTYNRKFNQIPLIKRYYK